MVMEIRTKFMVHSNYRNFFKVILLEILRVSEDGHDLHTAEFIHTSNSVTQHSSATSPDKYQPILFLVQQHNIEVYLQEELMSGQDWCPDMCGCCLYHQCVQYRPLNSQP